MVSFGGGPVEHVGEVAGMTQIGSRRDEIPCRCEDDRMLATIVAVCAVSRIALRTFASGDMSSASGSYMREGRNGRRRTSIGRAVFGNLPH